MQIYPLILSILKYLGLILATGSSLWTATNVVSKEVDGRKQLTRAGKISIALTIFGLLVSVVSNILQDQWNAKKAESSAMEEIKRTNKIILAGQPLTALKIEWKFFGVDTSFMSYLKLRNEDLDADAEDSQGGVINGGGDPVQIQRHFGLYPFLNAICYDSLNQDDDRNVLTLIALDQSENSVLSMGLLDTSIVLDRASSGIAPSSSLSGGIGFLENERFYEGGDAYRKVVREVNDKPSLKATGKDSIRISWSLDPLTFFNSLDKQNPSVFATANLPSTLKIIILNKMKNIPFADTNFSRATCLDIWKVDSSRTDFVRQEHSLFKKSSLLIMPNNLSSETVYYELEGVFKKPLVDPNSEDEFDVACTLLIFKLIERKLP